MTPEQLVQTLTWQLGHRLVAHGTDDHGVTARVGVSDWSNVGETCRDALGFRHFTFLSAIDWLPNPGLDGEKAYEADPSPVDPPALITDEVIRKAGGWSRFQVFARIFNLEEGIGLTLTADLDDDLEVPTWTSIYKGADWHERETWEMFGIHFTGHPGLRRIYLPAGFEGFPLRKDFALAARHVRPWPGLVDLEDMPKPEEGASE